MYGSCAGVYDRTAHSRILGQATHWRPVFRQRQLQTQLLYASVLSQEERPCLGTGGLRSLYRESPPTLPAHIRGGRPDCVL